MVLFGEVLSPGGREIKSQGGGLGFRAADYRGSAERSGGRSGKYCAVALRVGDRYGSPRPRGPPSGRSGTSARSSASDARVPARSSVALRMFRTWPRKVLSPARRAQRWRGSIHAKCRSSKCASLARRVHDADVRRVHEGRVDPSFFDHAFVNLANRRPQRPRKKCPRA
jgi:hypothetical protein